MLFLWPVCFFHSTSQTNFCFFHTPDTATPLVCGAASHSRPGTRVVTPHRGRDANPPSRCPGASPRMSSPPGPVGGRALAAAAAAATTVRPTRDWRDAQAMPPPPPRAPLAPRPPTVVDEDSWADTIAALIERDYFPELPRLASRLEWLQAVRTRDSVALASAQANIAARRAGARTPAVEPGRGRDTVTGFTPGWTPAALLGGGGGGGDDGDDNAVPPHLLPRAPPMTLDQFLASHTSEDNAAFADAVVRASQRRAAAAARVRARGAGDAAATAPRGAAASLFLPGGSDQTLALPSTAGAGPLLALPAGVRVADGAPLPPGASARPPPRVAATRFGATGDRRLSTGGTSDGGSSWGGGGGGSTPGGPSDRAAAPYGGGPSWSRVPTPRLDPGAGGTSPLVTWGEIAGTPLRLAPGDGDAEWAAPPTPAELAAAADIARGGGGFAMAPPTAREALARRAATAPRRGVASRGGTPLAVRGEGVTPRGGGAATLGRAGTPLSAAGARLAARLRSRAATPLAWRGGKK